MMCNIQRIILSNYVLVIEIVMKNCMDPSKIELYSRSPILAKVIDIIYKSNYSKNFFYLFTNEGLCQTNIKLIKRAR